MDEEETFEEMLDASLPKTSVAMLAAKYGRIAHSKSRKPRVGDYSKATKSWMKSRKKRKQARKRQRTSRRKNRGGK